MYQNHEIARGDDYTFTLTFKDDAEDPIDISGYEIFFTLKEHEEDADEDAALTVDVTDHYDAEGGITTIQLDSADTEDLNGTYFYDMQYRDTSGQIVTFQSGVVTFAADITRRTA